MRILMVGQHYYPDNFRINEISQELVRQGNEVDFITGLPDYASGYVPKEYRFFRRHRENIDGVNVVRVPVVGRRKGSAWRALNYISFMVNATVQSFFMKKDYDVIFCYQTSPIMMANAALSARKQKKKPLFLYCLDLWPESLKVWNVKENSLLFKVMHSYSRHVYKNCDRIGITSRPFAEYLTQVNGVDKEKIVYMPQHATDIFREIKGCYLEKDTVDFVFAGNVGSVQDIECVIRAAAELGENSAIRIHILGDGTELENCKSLTKKLQVEQRVIFYGRLPQKELKKHYHLADAFLLTLKGDNLVGSTTPGKLQEYMALGKPVLAAVKGAAKDIIEEAECGIVVPPSDEKALAAAILRFSAEQRKYRYMGDNGRAYYEKNFTKDVFIDRLMSSLMEMKKKEETICLEEKPY